MGNINQLIEWCDGHSGFLSLLLFIATLSIAWFGGFFQYVRHRPKFIVTTSEGPSFVTIVPHESMFEGRPTHRVVISLYLSIVNTGSAASSISKILASYQVPPASLFKPGWVTLKQTAALQEFSRNIGEHLKIYPFLSQSSLVLGTTGQSYYRVGEICNGIVYYESEHLAWGNHRPIVTAGKAKIKLDLYDSYGKRHRHILFVPEIPIEEAQKYSNHIGKTLKNLETSNG